MGKYYVEGGRPLSGQVIIQGSKNAALPMMAASLLHHGKTVLHNCPRIEDVYMMEKILCQVGAETFWEGHSLSIDCSRITKTHIDRQYAQCMRSSVLMLGSMLARKGKITVCFPGGCTIGKRPIDLHLKVLEKMGAEIITDGDEIKAETEERFSGCRIRFPISSVGATEQAVISAVLAKGRTVLENCALEPEITHLCRFLQAMGAEIGGTGTRTISIRGVGALRDVEFTVPGDRIVAGTYLFASAATRGKIEILYPPVMEMESILKAYEKIGGQWTYKNGKLLADAGKVGLTTDVETECYPGFPTDLQSVLLAVLSTIRGESHVKENIFENRFQVVSQLCKMGADIIVQGDRVTVVGKSRLKGDLVQACELRGGAALIVAALAADGVSVIENAHYIRRGYEHIEQDIADLGGMIHLKEQEFE